MSTLFTVDGQDDTIYDVDLNDWTFCNLMDLWPMQGRLNKPDGGLSLLAPKEQAPLSEAGNLRACYTHTMRIETSVISQLVTKEFARSQARVGDSKGFFEFLVGSTPL